MTKSKKITLELSPERLHWLEGQSDLQGEPIPEILSRLIDDAIARDNLEQLRPELESMIKSTVRNVVEMSITQKTMVAVKLFDEAVSPAMKGFGNRVTESVFKMADRVERLEKQIYAMNKGQFRDGDTPETEPTASKMAASAAATAPSSTLGVASARAGEPIGSSSEGPRKEGVLLDLRDHLTGGNWPE
ncbi:hypothetical protein GTO89_11660 [Heliobacterium gestii]|uniref:Uncharacterized protein n=1 Tax=Heliomicrobium gestii TaxID=2699 RepID=A0A845LBZ4_HELGE|nr:hypothetical protein [Heliomicrobium gestii]MBM7867434.1 hypothetical protein [Heliomicrobium gestii]MZP43698.1 hypothetical protein [Heliomicrobium gestii]